MRGFGEVRGAEAVAFSAEADKFISAPNICDDNGWSGIVLRAGAVLAALESDAILAELKRLVRSLDPGGAPSPTLVTESIPLELNKLFVVELIVGDMALRSAESRHSNQFEVVSN
jgi:hypothetical protein